MFSIRVMWKRDPSGVTGKGSIQGYLTERLVVERLVL